MTANLNPSFRLGCERLESRENPAGNVAVGLGTDGVLYATGDTADNLFSIQQNAAGDINVIGVDGTTINGLPSVYVGRGTLSGLNIQTGAGNDLAEVIGVRTPGTVYATLGDENDGVALYNVGARDVYLDGQGGDDALVTDGVVASNAAVLDGGAGNDLVDFRTRGLSTPAPYYFGIEQFVATNPPR